MSSETPNSITEVITTPEIDASSNDEIPLEVLADAYVIKESQTSIPKESQTSIPEVEAPDTHLDPDVQIVEQTILERTNRDITQMQSGAWGNESARRSGGTGYVQEWGKSNDRISMRAWDDFVQNNPDKARMYRGNNADINAAIERTERREARQRQDEQLKQQMQALQDDIDSAAAGFDEYFSRPDVSVGGQEKNDPLSDTIKLREDESVKILSPEIDVQLNEFAEPDRERGYAQEIFRKSGIETKKVHVNDNSEFPEAILVEKKEVPREKLVRLFRGVNQIDSSLFDQVPYAMRKEGRTGKPEKLREVQTEVDALAKNPSYENLVAYSEKVRPHLSEEEVARLDESMRDIEEGILNGASTRKCLLHEQIKHGGGWAESGISPYVSATLNPYEAAEYGKEGLVVFDVPLSEIEDFNSEGTEVGIKGALDKKYVTAVIPRKVRGETSVESDVLHEDLYQTLLKLYEEDETMLFSPDEMREARVSKSVEVTYIDKEQWEKDIELVRQKRFKKLSKDFPEIESNSVLVREKTTEEGVDIYTGAKRFVFDQYTDRLEKLGGRNVGDYDFQSSEFGDREIFDREHTTDIMLTKLRELVEGLERRAKEKVSAGR